MNDKRKPFTVHVIGAGKGESIILQMPNGEWGVVDCYAPSIKNSETNQTLRFLRRNEVESLQFLCLSHPHEDHFRGITHILTEYEGKIRQIWRFPARPLFKVVAHLQAESNEKEGHLVKKTSVAELAEFFRRVDGMRKSKSVAIRLVEGYKLIYSDTVISEGKSIPLKIFALGPDGSLVDAYQALIENYFKGKIERAEANSKRHNLISGVLLVKYGQTNVILGGDAERESWEQILNDSLRISEGMLIAADLVKISHHGSKRGIADSLWERLTELNQNRECYAVLTPFLAQRLPDKQAIEHIMRYTENIFSTSLPALSFRYRQPHEFLSEYQLRQQLKRAEVDARLLAEPPETISRCSFSFGADGNYLGSEFEGRGIQFLPA
jgi:hypothetical protein